MCLVLGGAITNKTVARMPWSVYGLYSMNCNDVCISLAPFLPSHLLVLSPQWMVIKCLLALIYFRFARLLEFLIIRCLFFKKSLTSCQNGA